MADPDERSGILFGRYQAIRIHAVIARLPKAEFTTGQVAQLLDGVKSDAVSKELSKLRAVGLVRSRSRSGDYERVEETCYWEFIEELSTEWGLE